MDRAIIDHRSADFAELAHFCLDGLRALFQTRNSVIIFPASGTGAWEAALVNTLSPGDRVLAFETGHFATQWSKIAASLGIIMDLVPGDWRHGADANLAAAKLDNDRSHEIKAVMVVHNGTSTGITSDIAAIRSAMNRARHPALLLVDTISSLASIDYRHDEWGVDVTVGGSQKGLMLPPGLSFNAMSGKALDASKDVKLPRSYWRWQDMLDLNTAGFFPYTPATNLLYGLREALTMLEEEGLPNVIRRHTRFAEATRRAVSGWGLELWARNPVEYSDSIAAVLLPEGHNESNLRQVILKHFDMDHAAFVDHALDLFPRGSRLKHGHKLF